MVEYSLKNANWPMVIYLSFIHIASVIGLFYIPSAKTETILFAIFLWPLSGLGITAGAHRLWAHRSHKASFPVRLFLMLCNTMANQGSLFHWCRDHRTHHKNSETVGDPHNALNGFFFAHMGWLLVKKDPKVIEAGKKLNLDDLLADPLVVWQKKYDPFFALFMCFVVPTLIPVIFWGEDWKTAYFLPGVLRYVSVLHFTWLVNSAAHLYGDHPYDPTINPAENLLVSVAAIGEGWHNWHHKYPNDYAASEFGVGKRFNPTKGFIDLMAFLGLVTDRKRALAQWERLKEAQLKGSSVPATNKKSD